MFGDRCAEVHSSSDSDLDAVAGQRMIGAVERAVGESVQEYRVDCP